MTDDIFTTHGNSASLTIMKRVPQTSGKNAEGQGVAGIDCVRTQPTQTVDGKPVLAVGYLNSDMTPGTKETHAYVKLFFADKIVVAKRQPDRTERATALKARAAALRKRIKQIQK